MHNRGVPLKSALIKFFATRQARHSIKRAALPTGQADAPEELTRLMANQRNSHQLVRLTVDQDTITAVTSRSLRAEPGPGWAGRVWNRIRQLKATPDLSTYGSGKTVVRREVLPEGVSVLHWKTAGDRVFVVSTDLPKGEQGAAVKTAMAAESATRRAAATPIVLALAWIAKLRNSNVASLSPWTPAAATGLAAVASVIVGAALIVTNPANGDGGRQGGPPLAGGTTTGHTSHTGATDERRRTSATESTRPGEKERGGRVERGNEPVYRQPQPGQENNRGETPRPGTTRPENGDGAPPPGGKTPGQPTRTDGPPKVTPAPTGAEPAPSPQPGDEICLRITVRDLAEAGLDSPVCDELPPVEVAIPGELNPGESKPDEPRPSVEPSPAVTTTRAPSNGP